MMRLPKETWGPGPWQAEVDELRWESAGLPCLIARSETGALCGYVGVERGHPFFGVSWFDLPDLRAHGGVNFTFYDEFGHFWLGFDCAHAWDEAPALMATLREIGLKSALEGLGTYRDLDYVQHQTTQLAEQVAEMTRLEWLRRELAQLPKGKRGRRAKKRLRRMATNYRQSYTRGRGHHTRWMRLAHWRLFVAGDVTALIPPAELFPPDQPMRQVEC